MSVIIHGNEYVTVAERLELAKKDITAVVTEVLLHEPHVVIKATVKTTKGVFTGISSANPAKAIEKASPYEVAETSAVGRALGFAGYGATENIASADEMKAKAPVNVEDPTKEWPDADKEEMPKEDWCQIHNVTMKKYEKNGSSWHSHKILGTEEWCTGKEKKQ